MLDEKLKEVVDLYPVEVMNAYRGRGAFVLVTKDGLRLLKEYPYSENHLIFESMLKYVIRDRGYMNVDYMIYNQEGALLTQASSGKKYVLKAWYEGHECDVSDEVQVMATSQNLARLHKVMKQVKIESEWVKNCICPPADEVFKKRSREMKAIRNYIRNKKIKNSFESLYILHYDECAGQAEQALKLLQASDYKDMYKEAVMHQIFCHGDYNHHNVMIQDNRIATVNFDRTCINIQIYDLYQFLRKTMEKNNWNMKMGMALVEAYHKVRTMTKSELAYLYTMLLYPEKFWKISNHYYNSRKSWTSYQNMEKLRRFIWQRESRNAFLGEFERLL